MDSFEKLTKKQLIEFLKNCRQPTFGNKPELIRRAKGAKELGLDNVDEVDSAVAFHSAWREFTCSITAYYGLAVGLWAISWPHGKRNIQLNYLVLSKRTFDSTPQSARRQLKAKIFYDEGHVQNIEINPVTRDSSHCIIKCECLPSIPTKDKSKKPAYKTWACLSKVTGRVHTAECNCVAG